jgi:hypothetical protein
MCGEFNRQYTLWQVDSLLDNDRETNNLIKAITRQWPVNSNIDKVLSVQFVSRYYKKEPSKKFSQLVKSSLMT